MAQPPTASPYVCVCVCVCLPATLLLRITNIPQSSLHDAQLPARRLTLQRMAGIAHSGTKHERQGTQQSAVYINFWPLGLQPY